MKEDPPGTFDRDAQRRAWQSVLSPERAIRYFFIPVARSDLGWDLYVHFMPAEETGHAWRGYLWADAKQMLSNLFPDIVWEDHAIEHLSREVCGDVFTAVRTSSDTLLFAAPQLEESLSTDGQETIILLPCDEYNMPHILHCVAKEYGEDQPCTFRTIEYKRLESEHKSLEADYKRMGEIDDQKTADVWEARGQRDAALKRLAKARSRRRRYRATIAGMYAITFFSFLLGIVSCWHLLK